MSSARPCQRTLASSSTSAKAARRCFVRSAATVACSAPMARCRARRFRRSAAKDVAAADCPGRAVSRGLGLQRTSWSWNHCGASRNCFASAARLRLAALRSRIPRCSLSGHDDGSDYTSAESSSRTFLTPRHPRKVMCTSLIIIDELSGASRVGVASPVANARLSADRWLRSPTACGAARGEWP